MKRFLLILALICWSGIMLAQPIDRIVAVIGDEIILQSDLENAYLQRKGMTGITENHEEALCSVFEEQLVQKALIDQARLDSIEVNEPQVNAELERRLAFFIQQFGSEQKLVEFYGKSLEEIQLEFRTLVEDQLLAQQIQGGITAQANVTPGDVKSFFATIPKDSIPYINAEVKLAHIVKTPPINQAEIQRIKDKLVGFKERVTNGEEFGTLAYLYSEDPGSARQNGELGFTNRKMLVKEFAAVAFKLAPGEVSGIVKSEYGYHLIQGIARRGEEVNVRHILLIPQTSSADLVQGRKYLDSLKVEIETDDSLSFNNAAEKFSDDEETAKGSGIIQNPIDGTNKFEMDQISEVDPSLFLVADKLKVGEISDPVAYQQRSGKRAFRIVKLVEFTPAHEANLKQDYARIKQLVELQKQNEVMAEWAQRKAKSTYIKIDDAYKTCQFTYPWENNTITLGDKQ